MFAKPRIVESLKFVDKPRLLIRTFMAKNEGTLKMISCSKESVNVKTMFVVTMIHRIRLLDIDIKVGNIDTWVNNDPPYTPFRY